MNVTVELPENIYKNVARKAQKNNKRVDEIIIDSLEEEYLLEKNDFAENISDWSDEDVLALANLKMPEAQAERMSELSELQQTGLISKTENTELEIYIRSSQIATLQKAIGIVEAVKRQLINSPKDLR